MPRVNGRGLADAEATLIEEHGALIVRVDCDSDPAFWLEVSISETELLEALAKVHRLTHSTPRPCGCEADRTHENP